MHEEEVIFQSGHLKIEGLYGDMQGDDAVVMAHPHPQMGGNMYNNVLEAMVAAFQMMRYSTLRFNFRGVGKSDGFYDNGRGEMGDIVAGKEFLQKRGKKDVLLSGYSFGAVVGMDASAHGAFFKEMILVAPPIFAGQSELTNICRKSGLIICGDEDQFCQPVNLKKWAEQNDFQFVSIQGADHFFIGKEQSIIKRIIEYLSERKME